MDSETVNGGVISNSALAIGSLLPGVSTALTFTFTLSMDLTADEEVYMCAPNACMFVFV